MNNLFDYYPNTTGSVFGYSGALGGTNPPIPAPNTFLLLSGDDFLLLSGDNFELLA